MLKIRLAGILTYLKTYQKALTEGLFSKIQAFISKPLRPMRMTSVALIPTAPACSFWVANRSSLPTFLP